MIKRVLVVDDDIMNLKMAEAILKQGNYAVHMVESGIECINFLRENRPDLILLDIEMPIMNGIKTLEKIKRRKDYKDIPVILLTAVANSETVLEVGKLGAVDYVKKPFMPQELLKRVDNAIYPNGKGTV